MLHSLTPVQSRVSFFGPTSDPSQVVDLPIDVVQTSLDDVGGQTCIECLQSFVLTMATSFEILQFFVSCVQVVSQLIELTDFLLGAQIVQGF